MIKRKLNTGGFIAFGKGCNEIIELINKEIKMGKKPAGKKPKVKNSVKKMC